MSVTFAVTAAGTVRRLPCATVETEGSSGITWLHCICRPNGPRVATAARILHHGQEPDVAAGTVPTMRRTT